MILRNLWHWKTKWAVNHLSKQLKRDHEFRESWKANIAMPIFDATRPKCNCAHELEAGKLVHSLECPMTHAYRRGDLCGMTVQQANFIADKLMRHLFGV